MKFTYTDADKLSFENASDVRMIDDDSGLRLFRGMISPWDAIKSFKETFYFQTRSAAQMIVAFVNALQILEPDQEKRQALLSGWWKGSMLETWGPEDKMGQVAGFEEDFSIPPFMQNSMYRPANYADWGDEFQGMPGYIRYASSDRIEKEVHGCFMDIAGPDACDLSQGGGQYFCKGLMGKNGEGYDEWNGYLVQRKGCGDPVCRVVWERASKFGEHKNHCAECQGYDWEEWGPTATGYSDDFRTPKKEFAEWTDTGYFIAALGQEWSAGEMFQQAGTWSRPYTNQVIEGLRIRGGGQISDYDAHVVKTMLDACGKTQFAEFVTRKAIRDWMNVPADVDDGRVMAGYISMLWQAMAAEWSFAEFTEERAVIDADATHICMYGQYPELPEFYEALFNGQVKTLVNTMWVVRLDREYLEEENVARFIVERAVYGNRRQKPDYDYDRTAENAAKVKAREEELAKIKARLGEEQ